MVIEPDKHEQCMHTAHESNHAILRPWFAA